MNSFLKESLTAILLAATDAAFRTVAKYAVAAAWHCRAIQLTCVHHVTYVARTQSPHMSQ